MKEERDCATNVGDREAEAALLFFAASFLSCVNQKIPIERSWNHYFLFLGHTPPFPPRTAGSFTSSYVLIYFNDKLTNARLDLVFETCKFRDASSSSSTFV